MAQQTLLQPPASAAQQTREQRPCPRPRTTDAVRRHTRGGTWHWPVLGLVVAFLLSLLAGALLAVHGPSASSGSSAAERPSVALQPEPPAGAEPAQTAPTYGPAIPAEQPADRALPAAPGKAGAKSAGVKKITLRGGDTLWALARTHGTTVKALQRLNDLGSSALIYAGKTLRVPTGPHAADSAGQSRATPPASAKSRDVQPTGKPAATPAAKTAIAYARAQLGKPYIWGGSGPRGYDCSGLVMRAWEAAGVKLPRTTWGQITAGRATTRAQLVPGDLVITAGGGHVQLYIGDGKAIHAPRPGRTVTVTQLAPASDVVGYRHITP